MSRVCQLSGKKPSFGHNVSFSKHRTNRRWIPNVHDKRIYVPSLGKSVRLRVSTEAIRTIDKKGIEAYLRDEGISLKQLEKMAR
jgi:large subunit ribosomal protein L28